MSGAITSVVNTLVDNLGEEYLTFNVSGIEWSKAQPVNASEMPKDICSFQSETLDVTKQATGIFSSELTNRDDLILAILSLLLLFVIEGILTTILLRTHHGNASNFGFSIRQLIELVRDFRFRFILRGHRESSKPATKRKINFKLLTLATVILLFTSVLEGVILFLSTPALIDVTNAHAAFTLVEVLTPDWNEIRDHVGAATVKPCASIILDGVEQGNTRITPCLTANGDTTDLEEFTVVDDDVQIKIVSQMHEFGAEHQISIGDRWSAKYSARAYFTLADRKRKLLRKRNLFYKREAGIAFLHRQYVAYLFNHYVRKTNDTQMNLDRLQKLTFNFKTESGGLIPIIQVPRRQRFRSVASTTHTTTVTGVLPRGPEALRLGTAVLKASTGIAVRGPDLSDLDMGSAATWPREDLMWREESRTLNWLSLTTVVASALLIYGVLRYLLKPIGTAEIAGAFVTSAVGADIERGPGFLGTDERSTFSLSFLSSASSDIGGTRTPADEEVRRSKSYSSVMGTNRTYSDVST